MQIVASPPNGTFPFHPLLHLLSLPALGSKLSVYCISSKNSGMSRPLRCRQLSLRFPLSAFPKNPARDALLPNKGFRDSSSDEDDDDDDEEEEEDVDAEEYDEVVLENTYEEDEDEEEGEEGTGVLEPSVATGTSGPEVEEHKCQRVAKLLAEVKEFGENIIDLQELIGIYDFPIDKFQRSAIKAFLDGSSVVVSAPTSSGKTLIAEAAAVATVAKGRRLFYTTPLKALSNQKFREFRDTFGENYVGLLTGDSAINKDAHILIMTTEILRNMLYQSVGMVSTGSRLFQVDVVILDEVHYLSDISRGTVWEETVIYCPKEVQLICLSATVANPDELSGWINQIHGETKLVTTKKRPVPLIWYYSLKNTLLPLLNERSTNMNRRLSLDYLMISNSEGDFKFRKKNSKHRSDEKYKSVLRLPKQILPTENDINKLRRSQVPHIRDTLHQLRVKNMLPAVWFIFSRKGCDAAVQYIENYNLLDDCEIDEVQLALKRFQITYPDAVRESAIKGILHGVAAHHAGCLPLWKSFVEELFQKGLVKVVFATETLAAGINMPARTAVIASLSKRTDSGRSLLSSNELHQMAGRAGRRGIDEEGYVVLVQTPYEGAEECCEVLFAGLQPLVSQFTASYGMVLNLLAGEKVTHRAKESATGATRTGRTLDEARKLVEQTFGNYVGSNVMVAVKEELSRIKLEIELLSSEVTEEAIARKCQEKLSELEYSEISGLQEELRAEKRLRTALQRKMELIKIAVWKPILEQFEDGDLPFICLQCKDQQGLLQLVPAVYINKLESLSIPQVMDMVNLESSDTDQMQKKQHSEDPDVHFDNKPCYYVALGSDNSWYLFTEKWIKAVYRSGLPDTPLKQGDALPRQTLRELLVNESLLWEKLDGSESGSIWCMEGSLETWSWSLNVPVLSSLSEDDEVRPWSQAYQDAVENYRQQKTKVSLVKKRLNKCNGFMRFKKIMHLVNFTKEKIVRLEAKSSRLIKRLEQIEPSGWKEFLQISNVIHEARALDINTHVIFPLGETAAAIRGDNELWIAMVLRNKLLLDLKPAQLAAVCGSLVSEGIRIRSSKSNCYIYEPSTTVVTIIGLLEEQRNYLLHLQEKHGVKIQCYLDLQFSGMIEAWASGLTWREIMMDSAMDDGDLARLLRRTIDLLAQIPKLPDIDPLVQGNAKAASNVMDRAPINELAG